MEDDSSIDDFFAKKDKSKKKSKSKTTSTTNDLLSQIEINHAKKQRQKREKETGLQAGLTDRAGEDVIGTKLKETEDWQDFEEELEKDYSGLRIQTLQISRDANEDKDEEEEEESQEEENDSSKPTRDLSQGPWKQGSGSAPGTTNSAPKQVAPEPEKPKEEAPKTGKYIPPSMRGGNSAANSSAAARMRPGSKKSAPNIKSEMDFPTLGGNKAPAVQESAETIENPNQRGKLNLTLGNKFSALQN